MGQSRTPRLELTVYDTETTAVELGPLRYNLAQDR